MSQSDPMTDSRPPGASGPAAGPPGVAPSGAVSASAGAPDAASATPDAAPATLAGGHGRVSGYLDRIRANPTGRLALRVGIGILGGLVVAIGIVLIPFPGPGWAIVILGLAIWAVEFVWARHLLHFTKRHVQSWTHWVLRQSLPLRALIGLAGFIFISAVVWLSVKLTMGIDLAVKIRDFLTG
ncbi:uncharacterized protein (TIGR02611 family) [Pseudosporangium ferrugineum]|uniref:Uncharacterized protein (TIGR02611 family) n=2 Tax=Pseudosporangium ferrugineum TaxID=439699 RepID=A0A2T0RQI8_9ACTN|nr:uncharacterized protein (TIGR02611 family) [Pseudosporangium ferrugineum]